MKKFLDNLVPVISGICITSMLMGSLLALGRCSIEHDERVRAANTYQYEITYVVYHPTEAKVHKRTGQCSYSDKYHRPHYEKRTRYAKNRLLVDHDEIYKGTDDFEVSDFTYHKVNNNK
jgi:hypothetical protein